MSGSKRSPAPSPRGGAGSADTGLEVTKAPPLVKRTPAAEPPPARKAPRKRRPRFVL